MQPSDDPQLTPEEIRDLKRRFDRAQDLLRKTTGKPAHSAGFAPPPVVSSTALPEASVPAASATTPDTDAAVDPDTAVANTETIAPLADAADTPEPSPAATPDTSSVQQPPAELPSPSPASVVPDSDPPLDTASPAAQPTEPVVADTETVGVAEPQVLPEDDLDPASDPSSITVDLSLDAPIESPFSPDIPSEDAVPPTAPASAEPVDVATVVPGDAFEPEDSSSPIPSDTSVPTDVPDAIQPAVTAADAPAFDVDVDAAAEFANTPDRALDFPVFSSPRAERLFDVAEARNNTPDPPQDLEDTPEADPVASQPEAPTAEPSRRGTVNVRMGFDEFEPTAEGSAKFNAQHPHASEGLRPIDAQGDSSNQDLLAFVNSLMAFAMSTTSALAHAHSRLDALTDQLHSLVGDDDFPEGGSPWPS